MYIDIKIIVKLTIPYEEMTATGWLEFQRGRKYWIISSNCKIKIEIRIKDQKSSQPAMVIPVSTTSTTTSTSITSDMTSESPSNSSGDEVWVEEISNHEDSNDVDTKDEARIQDESDDEKRKFFSLEFSLGGFSGIGLTVLVISIGYFARRIFLCFRNRRRLERERMRGDSLATDLSYQTPREIFA